MRFLLVYASLLAASCAIAFMAVRALGICPTTDDATAVFVLLVYGCAWASKWLEG